MLNIGMAELLMFGIIALLVLGPEKLPEGAKFAAKWYGKIKRFISSVQNEIDQELRLSEFRAEVQKEIEHMTELEKRMQQQIDALRQNSHLVPSIGSSKAIQPYFSYQKNYSLLAPYSTQCIKHRINSPIAILDTQTTSTPLKIAV